jgi:hypothetical protein
MSEPVELLATLRNRSLRNRVGLWLLPAGEMDQAADKAAKLGIDAADLRQIWLDRLPPDARFAGLNADKLISLLDDLTEHPGHSDCLLLYNLDLLLAGLSYESQQEIWRTLRQIFPHRRRLLVLVMPDQAGHLLPRSSDLTAWRQEGRLAGELTGMHE